MPSLKLALNKTARKFTAPVLGIGKLTHVHIMVPPLLKAAIGAITWLGLMAEIRRVYFMPAWMVRLGYHRQPSALAIATAKQAILLY